jgi:large subunit ribosomal protein L24e
MPKCSYCGKLYEPPRGLSYVLKDGTVKYLCSGKCKKNMFMKRRKVNWIRKGEKGKKRIKKNN